MRSSKRFLVVVSLVGLIVGCGGNTNGLVNQPNPRVRLFNAFSGISNAYAEVGSDQINGSANSPAIPFGSVSLYAITTNTTETLSAGDAAGSSVNNLSSVSDLFQLKGYYTGIGYGPSGNRKILVLSDTHDVAPSGEYLLRVVDVSATAGGAVDVYVTAPGASLPALPTTTSIASSTAPQYVVIALPGSSVSSPFEIRVYRQGDQTTALLDTATTTNPTLASAARGTLVVFDDTSTSSGVNAAIAADYP